MRYEGTEETETNQTATLEGVLWGLPAWRRKRWESQFRERFIRGDDADCWLWTGAKTAGGYGVFSLNRWTFRAHRLAYLLANGELRVDRYVLHRCDNPGCVNPSHLYQGTALDNVRDMIERGRENFFGGACGRTGEKHPNHRLRTTQVLEIRRRHRLGDSIKDLAYTFGVAASTISGIVHRRTWRHVRDDHAELSLAA